MASTEKFDASAQYLALGPINVEGALAYGKGDLVPAANVAKHGYLVAGLVGKVGNKAAATVQAELVQETEKAES